MVGEAYFFDQALVNSIQYEGLHDRSVHVAGSSLHKGIALWNL